MQIKQLLILSLSFCLSFHVAADNHSATTMSTETKSGTVVKVPLSNKSNLHAKDIPQRGTAKATVEKQHGKPLKKHPAKGQPPIERWDYEYFSVYFEASSVIHSVDKRDK